MLPSIFRNKCYLKPWVLMDRKRKWECCRTIMDTEYQHLPPQSLGRGSLYYLCCCFCCYSQTILPHLFRWLQSTGRKAWQMRPPKWLWQTNSSATVKRLAERPPASEGEGKIHFSWTSQYANQYFYFPERFPVSWVFLAAAFNGAFIL